MLTAAPAIVPDLSLVVPIYNESLRLGATLPEFVRFVTESSSTIELLIVDDGSTDDSAMRAAALIGDAGRVLTEPHRGKGGAVRAGMLAARGRHRIFLDVDLATPLDFVVPCVAALAKADIVIGSRRLATAHIERHQAPLREWLGRGFSMLSRTISGVGVSDFTCGFKGFQAEAADRVFSRMRVENWTFDTEMLFIATRLGLRIEELPVRWRDDARTKVRLGRDILGSLSGLAMIRFHHLMGRYTLHTP